jgi:hypothetical protein
MQGRRHASRHIATNRPGSGRLAASAQAAQPCPQVPLPPRDAPCGHGGRPAGVYSHSAMYEPRRPYASGPPTHSSLVQVGSHACA